MCPSENGAAPGGGKPTSERVLGCLQQTGLQGPGLWVHSHGRSTDPHPQRPAVYTCPRTQVLPCTHACARVCTQATTLYTCVCARTWKPPAYPCTEFLPAPLPHTTAWRSSEVNTKAHAHQMLLYQTSSPLHHPGSSGPERYLELRGISPHFTLL